MAETKMTTPRGTWDLTRIHTPRSSPLRAWSAADQLAVDHLGNDELGSLLIVNDEFGALSVSLADAAPVVWGDSALSRAAIDANLVANGLSPLGTRAIAGDRQPVGPFDTVIIRIPKSTALLEWQLGRLKNSLAPDARVVGAGMARHIHRSTVEAFERRIGATTTSRATRKARLIHAKPNGARFEMSTNLDFDEYVTDQGIRVAQLPGIFSAGHLDVGSVELLANLRSATVPPLARVVDLGCGNGVLAASMASVWPQAHFHLVDVSDLAIAAAHETWRRNDLDPERYQASAADGLTGLDDGSVDVVITNPPFHQGHSLDPNLTDRLLADVARVLRAEGRAYVVAQRHLNLHTRLRRWFATVETISKHPSHVVLHARRGPAR